MTSIISLIDEQHIFANLEANDKNEALSTLISSFEDKVDAKELSAIKDAIFEREKIMSTGVGKGLAIPHGKAMGIKKTRVAFALLDTPIAYKAIDGEPVSIIFLLAGPSSSNSLHIKMLSRISRLMNNNSFRQKLKDCTTPNEIIEVFKEGEQAHFGE